MITATEMIEESLPRFGKLVVFQCTGAACDNPIFYEGDKCKKTFLFHFSSYGMVPPNYEDFDDLHNFGLCGSSGNTNDVKVVARAIEQLNQKKRVGLCEGFVIDQLLAAGFQVERVNAGFR